MPLWEWDIAKHHRMPISDDPLAMEIKSRIMLDCKNDWSLVELRQSFMYPYGLKAVPLFEYEISFIAPRLFEYLSESKYLYAFNHPRDQIHSPWTFYKLEISTNLAEYITENSMFEVCSVILDDKISFVIDDQHSDLCVLAMKEEMFPAIFGNPFEKAFEKLRADQEKQFGERATVLFDYFSWQVGSF